VVSICTEYDLRSGVYLDIDMSTVTLSVPEGAQLSVQNHNTIERSISITKSTLRSSCSSKFAAAAAEL
jgi:hypothetical protein